MRRVITTFGFGEVCEPLARISAPSFAKYAIQHGYAFFQPSEWYFDSWQQKLDGRGASWLKVLLLLDLLTVYEEVLWLDCDVLVVRFDKDIAEDLTPAPMHMVVHHTPDGLVPNCGVWHLRRSAIPTLEKLWDLNHFDRSHGWWEQAAVISALGGNPDAFPAFTPPGPLWGELPYVWNPHIRSSLGLPADMRFFHATMFPDRQKAMEEMRDAFSHQEA